MAKKVAKKKVAKKEPDGFYKGYDIKWLRSDDAIDHPDRYLVDEYDKKHRKAVK